MVKVYYQYRYNFIWTYEENSEGWETSRPKGKSLGKIQIKNPFRYDNILLGEL